MVVGKTRMMPNLSPDKSLKYNTYYVVADLDRYKP